jgi:CHAT domain-containing protein
MVDDLHPDLSGIVLASGEGEDGLLQVREIVDLDLTGRTVILSACRSASGATLEGEGVLSLARAFFVAGAQAVVANLWPVRDDEAAAFTEDLYRYIGEGEDVASALALARRDRVAAGDSTEAWAGTVLFGNGRVRPFGGEAHQAWWSWLYVVAIAGILAVIAGFRGRTLQRR